MSKPALSISQLAMISRCGLQYQFRYCDDKKSIPSTALHLGSATHHSIEGNLRHALAHEVLLPLEAVKEAAGDELERLWSKEEPKLNKTEKSKGAAATRGATKDQAIALAELHHIEVAPHCEPLSVERRWRVDASDWPVALEGVLDLEEPRGVTDWKTGKRRLSEDAAHESVQLTAYALALQVERGAELTQPIQVRIGQLVANKKPVYQDLISHRCLTDYLALKWRMLRANEIIEKGAFMPADPGAANSPCSWCGYTDDCPAFVGRTHFQVKQ